MSQSGEVDVVGAHPEIPTNFIANSGDAIPISNTLEVLGEVIANAGVPFQSVGSGNTITYQVQLADETAMSDATKVGLAAFHSAAFDVDGNGFVTLLGGGVATTNIDVDTSTAPGTDPVVPNGLGNIVFTGNQVASGVVGANVIQSNSVAASSVTYEIQRAGSSGTADLTLNGVSHFNSSEFSVDSDGFVSLIGGGAAIDSIGVDSTSGAGTNPVVPDGTGLVTHNGAVIAAGNSPVGTVSTAPNVYQTQVQLSQAIAAPDASAVGLCNFDSSGFDVDSDGFVSLAGGGTASTSFDVQSNTVPGTDPVIPTSLGVVTVNGAAVANHSVVLETRSRAANAYNIEVQYATSAAATDATKSGVAHFDSTDFTVDGNGFVALSGSGAGQTITGDSGGALAPSSGNWNLLGNGSITTSGTGSTLTSQLTGLTNHAVLVGAGTTTITKVGPTATAGQVLQSAGSSADPAFSTATYPATTTVNQLLYSSSANTVAGLATANGGVLTTDSSGVPSIDTTNFVRQTTGMQVKGNNTNTSPPAGFLGEQISSAVIGIAMVNSTPTTITSISVTAGIWDIHLNFQITNSISVAASSKGGISTVAATFQGNEGDQVMTNGTTSTVWNKLGVTISGFRVALTSTTTYYLIGSCVFGGGTTTGNGRISATRVG